MTTTRSTALMASSSCEHLVHLPLPPQEGLLGEEQVLAVLHVEDAVAPQRVLVVAGRQIGAQHVLAAEDGRVELDHLRERALVRALEVRVDVAGLLGCHQRQQVRAHCPARLAVVGPRQGLT